MTLKCGIVGLPNIGKSTLFNAMTANTKAEVANYPFCTIEPNNALVTIPNKKLYQLAAIANSQKIIPSMIEFVDIAGLVKGASSGEGLGNKFLSHIRQVDAIIHVLRCFEDDQITHVHGTVDPIYDAKVIETELIMADFESVQRRLVNLDKKVKSGDKEFKPQLELMQDAYECLSKGQTLRSLIGRYDIKTLNALQLLTSKPVLYLCNVSEHNAASGNQFSNTIINKATQEKANYVIISSKIEAEIATLTNEEEKLEFLNSLELQETGLNKVIQASYDLLNLKHFFTVGPKESKAWIFENGATALQAAGLIHTDFQKGFIRAEIISYDDYIKYNGETIAKANGRTRLEGKEYVMQDSDIVHFRFNV